MAPESSDEVYEKLPENGEIRENGEIIENGGTRGKLVHASTASIDQFPKTVWLIVGNEFCERFSYYGMRAVLALYFADKLGFSENSATEAVHLFIVAAYLAPLFGAILSDSFIGKYRTIMYLSIIYCIGNWTLSLSAFDWSVSTARGIAFLGLLLISIGTGGIKPCVSAFGGDQIEFSFAPTASRDELLRLFFSAFYFSINVGATLSTIVTPWARTTFNSYAVAFGLPAALLVVATFIFWTGNKKYVHQPPAGNLLTKVFGIVVEGVRAKMEGKEKEKEKGNGKGKGKEKGKGKGNGNGKGKEKVEGEVEVEVSTSPEGSESVPLQTDENPKEVLVKRGSKRQVLDPRATKPSHWLDGAKGKYGDQEVEDVKLLLQVLTLFIPVPIFWSLFDQQASRWVFQAQKMNGKVLWFTIEPDQMQTANSLFILVMIPLFDRIIYPQLSRRGIDLRPIRRMVTGMAFAVFAFLISGGLQIWMDSLTEPATLNSTWTSVKDSPPNFQINSQIYSHIKTQNMYGGLEPRSSSSFSHYGINNGTWGNGRYVDTWQTGCCGFQMGPLNTVDTLSNTSFPTLETNSKTISILWQLPQFVVMTAGEIMFSITGLELAYSQAPSSMTSVVSSFWCLTVAFGNLFTVLVVGTVGPHLTQSQEFFFFAGGCALALLLLIFVGRGFTYVETAPEEEEDERDVEAGSRGIHNSNKNKNSNSNSNHYDGMEREESHALAVERS